MPSRDLKDLYLEPKYLTILLDLIKKHTPNAEIWIYGSRINGKAHEGSDLDLVLRNPQDLKKEVPNWCDLKEAIEESIIPIIVELHLWAYLPEAFHRNIEQDYIILQTGQDT